MANNALVGRCGIYCGSCVLYRAYKDEGEYLQQVSEAWEMPVEKIRCEGCHALTVNCAGSKCRIVKCLASKGFEYCSECPEYEAHACEKHEGLSKRWVVDNVDLRVNLERIKAGAVGNWLKECQERFRCTECGKPLPVLGWNVKKRCYHCGVELSE
ncbi:MAG: DUF3795 domain-containing protein [Candidatus Bathyarchaeota archaeon]|nr:MAG: DUF3795 domain-containing protein [Candidatus Bathyarchaeota archaeon]